MAPETFADTLERLVAKSQELVADAQQRIEGFMAVRSIDIPFHLDDDLKSVASTGEDSKIHLALLVQIGRDVRELADLLGKSVTATDTSPTISIVPPTT